MNFKKLFFVFGALGMLLSSCSKIAEVENPDEPTGLPCVITATFDATRTSVDDNWNTTWNNNDKITVYVTRDSGSGNKYGYSNFTYNGEGKFSGTVNGDFCSPYNWFAVYPSFKTSSSTSSKVEAEIEHPASQTMTGDTKAHIAGANDPAFGYALGVEKDPSIRMHHIASVIDFNITNGSDKAIKVTKVEFTAPEKIAGDFTADVNLWDSEVEAPEWKADNSAVNTVTLNVSEGVEIAKDGTGHFYAAIHPISAKGDYTIKVTATSEGKTYVTQKTVNAELTFKAGEYKTVSFKFVPGEPEPPTKTYSKVTSAPSNWSGTYLIVKESSNYAFAYDQSSYKTSVTINSSKIVSADLEKYEVTISLADDGETDHYVVKTSNGKYLYRSSDDDNNFLNDTNEYKGEAYYAKIGGSNGNFTLGTKYSSTKATTYYFRYSSSSSAFSFSSSSSSNTIQLYKLEDNRQAQNISFAKEAVELTLGDDYKVGQSYDVQSLSGEPKTTVTWTSSDEEVATVANDGKITIKGAGETVITATAAESAEYKKATASYTLTIIDPAQAKYYVKVMSAPEDWSGTYLIVDESAEKAFDENASSYASSVTINDDKVLCDKTVAKYQVTISPSSVSGMYDIKTVKGQYMYSYKDGETTLNKESKDSSDRTYYNSLSINSGDVTMYSTRGGDGSVNYFGYVSNTSDNPNKKNFGYKKDATTRTVQLYKLQSN